MPVLYPFCAHYMSILSPFYVHFPSIFMNILCPHYSHLMSILCLSSSIFNALFCFDGVTTLKKRSECDKTHFSRWKVDLFFCFKNVRRKSIFVLFFYSNEWKITLFPHFTQPKRLLGET